MAQFYASIQGNRDKVTRMGTKSSGITCHIRGWHIGVRVDCYHDKTTGKNEIYVYRTGGSSNPSGTKIAHLVEFES